jgi:(2Fe-2S) ferredoxin
MSRYDKHIFICTNERTEGHPKGCCKEKGSELVRDLMKQEIKTRGLASSVRVNTSGCLDACEFGISIVVYPDAIWYGGVKQEDIQEIIDSHIIGGMPVERLRIRDKKYSPDFSPFTFHLSLFTFHLSLPHQHGEQHYRHD